MCRHGCEILRNPFEVEAETDVRSSVSLIHSLLEGGQRLVLHVVTAAEPVRGGGVADGRVHGTVFVAGPVALGLRDHVKRPDPPLRGLSVVALLRKLLPFLPIVGAAAFCIGILQREKEA